MEENIPRNGFEMLNEYKKILETKNLPCIYSTKHFALLIDIKYTRLIELLKNREALYHYFYLKKKDGKGHRCIMAPNDELKYIQKTIYHNILKKVILDEVCIGFTEGKSSKDNADIHKNQEVVFTVDLYRFFDSIDEKRVYGLFKKLGYESNISYSLAKLCTVRLNSTYLDEIKQSGNVPDEFWKRNLNRLPQGAPTSPAIANIIASRLDYRLRKLCEKSGVKYSRYADDITISGNRIQIPSFRIIKEIIEDEGFYVNTSKIRKQNRGNRQIVTGLTVTEGVHVPKEFKQEIKRHIYYCRKYGVYDHLRYMKKQYHFERYHYKEWLLGKILYIKGIEEEVGKKLLIEYNKINWIDYEV